MDFKAEHTSKIDASVIWQTQVGTRENCGVAHVESKQIFEPTRPPWIDAGSLLDGQSLRSGHADKRTDVSARRAGHCSWRTRDLEVRRGSAYVMLVARVASAAGGGG